MASPETRSEEDLPVVEPIDLADERLSPWFADLDGEVAESVGVADFSTPQDD